MGIFARLFGSQPRSASLNEGHSETSWQGPGGSRVWEEVQLPISPERVVGFSIPEGDVLWVLSFGGLHCFTLAPSISVATLALSDLDCSVYDEDGGVLLMDGKRYPLLGQNGGAAVLELATGERALLIPDFDMGSPAFLAGVPGVGETFGYLWPADEHKFGFVRGTFSADGRYIVVGSARGVRVFRRKQKG
jgi:hypothetical protein